MRLVADLHLHSKYSRAVSQNMVLSVMAKMAKVKGIDLLATGDFTHPLWVKELDAQLEEVSAGIYEVRGGEKAGNLAQYILGTEISCIYSQGGRGRRIHVLVFAPNLEVVHKINEAMRQAGCNLLSDGRPIIGLSLIQLTELLFGIDEQVVVIPAHVWTPWFGLYGSQSGFDSLQEAFGDHADKIYAVETGLSSDPAMNWRIAELDGRAIVSFSDAHSPAKLGRELTVFIGRDKRSGKFTYRDFVQALKQARKEQIALTIEFYPEEGKYHYTGHRNCQVVQSPEETRKRGATCHVCGRPLTVGVIYRVDQLAGREIGEALVKTQTQEGVCMYKCDGRPPYMMLVPLLEILAEVFAMGQNTAKVQTEYDKLVGHFGSELQVLTKTSLDDLEKISGAKFAEAMGRVRRGDIFIAPGYDGIFGKVKIWGEKEEVKRNEEQMSLF